MNRTEESFNVAEKKLAWIWAYLLTEALIIDLACWKAANA
jgi:hypothetical protein